MLVLQHTDIQCLLRRERDSNPRYSYPYTAFRVRPDRPLRHLSFVSGCKYRDYFSYFRPFSKKNTKIIVLFQSSPKSPADRTIIYRPLRRNNPALRPHLLPPAAIAPSAVRSQIAARRRPASRRAVQSLFLPESSFYTESWLSLYRAAVGAAKGRHTHRQPERPNGTIKTVRFSFDP